MPVAVVGDTAATELAVALGDHDVHATAVESLDGIASAPHVVWAAVAPALARPQQLAHLDATTWTELTEAPLRAMLTFLRQAHRLLAAAGGACVVLIPTLALEGGAPGLVAWATVAEAERALVKSVARVWGRDGISANCLAVPPALLSGHAAAYDRPGLAADAFPPPTMSDVAAVVASLLGTAFGAVSGQTIGVDGGGWTAP